MSREPQNDAHVHLRLISDPRYLSGARELVTALSRRLGFDETTGCQIALAVDEALANVMRHGYQGATDKPIWIDVWPLEGGGLRIVIEDEARQVDPAGIKGRDLEDIKPGGLGVHIIREVMDTARYECRPEVGMRLTLEKRLPVGKPAGANTGETACGDV
jgi:anti-sigma regulatory factor (Ser/Thr protein kinase)